MQRVDIVDLSVPFSEGMPKYPADWLTPFTMRDVRPDAMAEARWKRRFTEWTFNPHTATHVETADHVFRDGRTVDAIPLAHFVGVPHSIDLTDVPDGTGISLDLLAPRLQHARVPEGAILLLHTGYDDRAWGTEQFWPRSPWLHPDAAAAVRDLRPALIGLDFQTERPGEREFVVHKTLVSGQTVLCEYLFNLRHVQPGRSLFVALPIGVRRAEASPVRAVLINGLPLQEMKRDA